MNEKTNIIIYFLFETKHIEKERSFFTFFVKKYFFDSHALIKSVYKRDFLNV